MLGANTHNFSVERDRRREGDADAASSPSAAVGLGVGTPSLGTCSVIDRVVAVAGPAVLMSGTATVPGLYCVTIFDLGNLVEPAAYTIDVLHS